jgi:predicted nucleic acid-binding protein
VIDLVIDANVVLAWLRPQERLAAQAAALVAAFRAGTVCCIVPPLSAYEVLNVAGRKWRQPSARLEALAELYGRLGLRVVEPPLREVARWTARGLTAYDAAYVAVAERTGATLVTGDDEVVARAPERAHPLARVEQLLAGAGAGAAGGR